MSRGWLLRQFKPKVAIFHDARIRPKAGSARDEDGLRISMAEWLELL
jgi:hypothetical protein